MAEEEGDRDGDGDVEGENVVAAVRGEICHGVGLSRLLEVVSTNTGEDEG